MVSCSYLRPVKRINLLCDAINYLGKINNDWSLNWNHFGGGSAEETARINQKISEFMPNIKVTMWGNVPNKKIFDFYRNNPVDFFISVSESEGIPMSMMEAISCGIPIISTDVGGVQELVTENCGILLPVEISAEQIATAMANFIDDKKHITLRIGAKDIWHERFSGHQNYSDFGKKISKY